MELFNMNDLFASLGIENPAAPAQEPQKAPQAPEAPQAAPIPQAPQRAPEAKQEPEAPAPTKSIEELKKLPGLQFSTDENNITWISGDTKTHREALKAAKARWNPERVQWYIGKLPKQARKTDEEIKRLLMEKVEELKALPGISIELVGKWLWISGDTKNQRQALKAAGCKWAQHKKMWNFHIDTGYFKKGKEKEYEEITATYGQIKLF